MSLLVAILVVALLGAIILVIGAPLRAARRSDRPEPAASVSSPARERPGQDPAREQDELEAARAAKYREIRDAELDFRTGKLSREDYQAIDGELRGEAIEILDRLERLDASASAPAPEAGSEPPSGVDDQLRRT